MYGPDVWSAIRPFGMNGHRLAFDLHLAAVIIFIGINLDRYGGFALNRTLLNRLDRHIALLSVAQHQLRTIKSSDTAGIKVSLRHFDENHFTRESAGHIGPHRQNAVVLIPNVVHAIRDGLGSADLMQDARCRRLTRKRRKHRHGKKVSFHGFPPRRAHTAASR